MDSLVLKVDIHEGCGKYIFPSYKLKDDLFINKINAAGLFCRLGPVKLTLFVTSNCSEHGFGRKVITNILGVFTFP